MNRRSFMQGLLAVLAIPLLPFRAKAAAIAVLDEPDFHVDR